MSSAITAFLVGGGSYLVARRISKADGEVLLEQAKAKAKAIEFEAEKLLQESQLKSKDIEIKTRQKYEREGEKILQTYEYNLQNLEKERAKDANKLEREYSKIENERQKIEKERQSVNAERAQVQKAKENYQQNIQNLNEKLQKVAQMTKEQAKAEFLARIEDEFAPQAAQIIRAAEERAQADAKARANYILAQATSRFAGEFAAERLIHTITLPSNDIKGRIIGKEGRNIHALEMICGVDIIIDETPGVILLSSHNLYRRCIAARTIELLIADGRIHPARIEEVYKRCEEEFENSVYEEGEQVCLDLRLSNVHSEIKKLLGKLRYRASYGQNALAHSLEVANLAGIIAAELGGDCNLAIRAGLLHDIGKAKTHEMQGSHVDLGADICRRYNEHPVVLNAVLSHHGNEPAKSIEAFAVCAADALSAARPGARRDVLESYLKRVSDIENIALSKMGVLSAYAINAGREVRVIVRSEDISDDESGALAAQIAKEISEQVQFPGEIKVSVIRESRAIAFAS